MDWRKILMRHLLSGVYTKAILDRGKVLNDSDAIIWLEINDEDIDAEVSGSYGDEYYVDFIYDAAKDKLQGSCICPYGGPCKHQVAVLLEAIDNVKHGHPIPTPLSAPAVQKTSGQNKLQRYMDHRSADTLRYLPLAAYEDLDDLLMACAPRRHAYLYAQYVEEDVQSDLTLQAEAFDMDWKGRKTIHFSIDIISDDKGIGVICKKCTSKTDRLCKHQYHVLMELSDVLHYSGYITQTLTIDDLYQQCIAPAGLQSDSWQHYVKLKLNEETFFAEALSTNVMPPNWVENAIAKRNIKPHTLTQKWRKRDWIDIRQDFEKHAYLWSTESFKIGTDSLLRFVSGYAYKTKEGINSRNRVIQKTANLFPEAYQDLADRCLKYSYILDKEVAFDRMHQLLLSNLDTLNDVHHYVYTDILIEDAINNKALHLVQFSLAPLLASFSVKDVDGLIELKIRLEAEGNQINVKDVIYKNRFFCATRSFIYIYPHRSLSDYLTLFDTGEKVILTKSQIPNVEILIADIQKHYHIDIAPSLLTPPDVLTDPRYQVYLQEMDDIILFEPILSYDVGLINAFHNGPIADGIRSKQIDESDRSYLLDFLGAAHPKFHDAHHHDGYLYLVGRDMIKDMWFLNFAEACRLARVELLGRDQLKKYKYSLHRGTTTLSVSSGIDWFEVNASLTFGEEEVKQRAWIQAIQRGDNYVLLQDGSYGILPQEWLGQIAKTLKVAEVEKGDIKISKYRYNIIDELFTELDDDLLADIQDRRALFNNYFSKDKGLEIPSSVTADLRSYQKEGVRWLHFLDETNCGGILADDMGLGKTLQIITLLAQQSEDQTSLVIVPRSLLFNWAAELDKFCEPLIYLIHHGPDRAELFSEIEHAQIIITTYDTMIRDVEMFRPETFNYIILDESQAIKNPLSKRYKALRLLKARNRIAMTGTPIENNTFDLYAQLSFTSPGLLGSAKSFKENFARPIDKEGSKDAADLLKKMIHPFILRRTKEQVAKDLPAKVEQTILCDMGPSQRRLYDQLRIKIKSDLEQSKNDKGTKGQLRFKILEGLLRLRQMCNAPYLVNKALGASADNAIKLDILSKQFDTVTKQHKVLVFSQFVGMLSLIKNMLDAENIKYAYLDGSTRDRQEVVEEFQNDETIKVFLISLKAGNTGLNLTQADYVYIVDPWWNPAAEAQAIDRTHRIGQDKPVFAYKMICRDTIEEKILELQAKKKALACDLIQVDDDVFKQLDENALMELFD